VFNGIIHSKEQIGKTQNRNGWTIFERELVAKKVK